jgi:hypothetical protein
MLKRKGAVRYRRSRRNTFTQKEDYANSRIVPEETPSKKTNEKVVNDHAGGNNGFILLRYRSSMDHPCTFSVILRVE